MEWYNTRPYYILLWTVCFFCFLLTFCVCDFTVATDCFTQNESENRDFEKKILVSVHLLFNKFLSPSTSPWNFRMLFWLITHKHIFDWTKNPLWTELPSSQPLRIFVLIFDGTSTYSKPEVYLPAFPSLAFRIFDYSSLCVQQKPLYFHE